jgi:hypothetical protein
MFHRPSIYPCRCIHPSDARRVWRRERSSDFIRTNRRRKRPCGILDAPIRLAGRSDRSPSVRVSGEHGGEGWSLSQENTGEHGGALVAGFRLHRSGRAVAGARPGANVGRVKRRIVESFSCGLRPRPRSGSAAPPVKIGLIGYIDRASCAVLSLSLPWYLSTRYRVGPLRGWLYEASVNCVRV